MFLLVTRSIREISEDGKELLFDHGAPFFSVSNCDVLKLVHEWESKGLVAEWKENFGSFDCISKKFLDNDQVYDHPDPCIYSCSSTCLVPLVACSLITMIIDFGPRHWTSLMLVDHMISKCWCLYSS